MRSRPFQAVHIAALAHLKSVGCSGPCEQGKRPEKCPADCGHRMAHMAQMPAAPARLWDPATSNAVQSCVKPPLWRRLRDWLVDPVIRD